MPLVHALKDRNEFVREGAADALVRIGDSVVVPLIKELRDKNEYNRKCENDMVGKIRDEKLSKDLR